MTRKESERDTERPHYYSQFWLDVAAGRKVIGAPKTDETAEGAELEPVETAVLHKAGHNNTSAVTDEYKETRMVEPALALEEDEELEEPELDNLELINEVDDLDIPNIEVDETSAPEMDLIVEEEEEPEEEFFEDEDEDEDEWNTTRGRKKPKPGRQTKLPPKLPPKRPGKREPRRGF